MEPRTDQTQQTAAWEPMAKAATPVPSLSDQWRAYVKSQDQPSRSVPLVLPSGMTVRAQRPNLLLLLRTGRIPDTLTGKVEDLIATASNAGAGGVQAGIVAESRENPAAFYATWTNLLNVVWLEAVTDPVFGTGDGDIPIDAVTMPDKEYLFMWCQGVSEDVATFLDRRARSAALVGDASVGNGVRAESGNVPRD